jgi:hypothetical protein
MSRKTLSSSARWWPASTANQPWSADIGNLRDMLLG